ncbi:hypothetical protein Tco_0243468 [Tanacetum coccineum]
MECNHLNIFKVEEQWTQMLQFWKGSHIMYCWLYVIGYVPRSQIFSDLESPILQVVDKVAYEIDLQKKARRKTSKEILEWLRDEAVKIVIQFKSCKKRRMDDSHYKFIVASSMYRVSQTILIHCSKLQNWPLDGQLLEWISNMIADILCACFTNLPCVIKKMCHHDAIEKREDSVRSAAQLLGKSRKILEILNTRQLPNLDVDSMAYIGKWHALPKSEIPNGAPLNQSQLAFPSPNESVIVNIGV